MGHRVLPLERQSAQPAYAKYRDGFGEFLGELQRLAVAFGKMDPASPNLFRFEPLAVSRNSRR